MRCCSGRPCPLVNGLGGLDADVGWTWSTTAVEGRRLVAGRVDLVVAAPDGVS